MEKTCPKCNETGDVETRFGWRTMDGVKRPQSQCKSCRSGKAKVLASGDQTLQEKVNRLPKKQRQAAIKKAKQEAAQELAAEWSKPVEHDFEHCDACGKETDVMCPACGGAICETCPCSHGEDEDEEDEDPTGDAEAEFIFRSAAVKTKAAPKKKAEPPKSTASVWEKGQVMFAMADRLTDTAQDLYEKARKGEVENLVLELSSKWTVCSGCSASWRPGEPRFKMTLDPVAAGWLRKDYHAEGEWDCIDCQQEALEHGWVEYEKKGVTIRLGYGDNAWRKSYNMKQLDEIIKATKDKKHVALMQEWRKNLDTRKSSSSYTGGHSARDGETELIMKLLNFKQDAPPPAPHAV